MQKAGQRQSLPLYRWQDRGLERDGQLKDIQLANVSEQGEKFQLSVSIMPEGQEGIRDGKASLATAPWK